MTKQYNYNGRMVIIEDSDWLPRELKKIDALKEQLESYKDLFKPSYKTMMDSLDKKITIGLDFNKVTEIYKDYLSLAELIYDCELRIHGYLDDDKTLKDNNQYLISYITNNEDSVFIETWSTYTHKHYDKVTTSNHKNSTNKLSFDDINNPYSYITKLINEKIDEKEKEIVQRTIIPRLVKDGKIEEVLTERQLQIRANQLKQLERLQKKLKKGTK